jgi:hypothetical protein
MAANKKSYDQRIQDRMDAAVQKARDNGSIGDILAIVPPDVRKKIHESARRNASKEKS